MSRLKLLICLCVVGSTALLAGGVAPAAALTFTVNNDGNIGDDNVGDGTCQVTPGNCTLRAALDEANDNPADPDTINFLPNLGPIMVIAGTLPIEGPVTIDGNGSAGAGMTVIDGNDLERAFFVVPATATTTFKDLRIEDGSVEDEPGGAIRTEATTTLNNVVLHSSESFANLLAVDGGAIASTNSAATLTVQDSIISDNSIETVAGRDATGGGISSAGPLVVTNSVLSGNSINGTGDDAQGGGIFADSGFTITDSTVALNDVAGTNLANVEGGGIFASSNPATNSLTNSTVSGNSASGGGGGGGAHLGEATTITNVTFKNNGGGNPDGDDLIQYAGTATVGNTIFDNPNACVEETTGVIISASPGHNIDAAETCGFGTTQGNMENTDPMLQTGLIQFGTPPGQFLHIAFATSPAIDNADSGCAGGLDFDQRGLDRPQGPACDIGAYERDYRDLNVTVNGSGTVSGTGINCISGTGDCEHEFLDDSPDFVLTATPAAGFQFSSWAGCVATGNQCTVDTGNDRMVTATFTAIPSTGGGGGDTTTPTPTKKKCKKGRKLKKGKCVKKKKKRKQK